MIEFFKKILAALNLWAKRYLEKDVPESKLPAWYRLARIELGVQEIVGPQHNKRILEYHRQTSLEATDDETAWCASFVSWCLEMSGIESARSAWAKSYANYGTELKEPVEGCICVFTRGDGGHVGFYVSENGSSIMVLGGNQSNEVSVAAYPKSKLIGYRWPPSERFFPEKGNRLSFEPQPPTRPRSQATDPVKPLK